MVQKKLVYMYLGFYVRNKGNHDLALLCINTIYKDCNHTNPIVRGLALRSLSSLRLKNLVEYIRPMVAKGLEDSAPYTRKSAAIAAIKLSHIQPSAVLGRMILSFQIQEFIILIVILFSFERFEDDRCAL
jgi:vesicle coat complex subunit